MKIKKSKSYLAFCIFDYCFLGLFALLCLYPFWYIVAYSISDPSLVASRGVTFFPQGFSLFFYKKVFQIKGIGNVVFISVARTVIGTILSVFASSFMGYLFTKQDMPMRKFFYRYMVVTMYVGGGMIPVYLTISAYHLTNTFWVYIIPGIVGAYNVILVKTFVEQLPASLEESAVLDGAGYFTVYSRIIVPLSKPIIATISTFNAVGHWNSYWDNYLYVTDYRLNTLQYQLYKFLNSAQELANLLQRGDTSAVNKMEQELQTLTPMGVRMTITVISILPIFCVYPFMQKYFAKGIMIGAVKG